MNTLHLTYAVEVERCGSITQAAENLYMAQPNLSKAIKELEESMGFSIFARTSRGVVPTDRGREFLVYARAILAQVQKMEELSGHPGGPVQRLRLILPRSGLLSLRAAELLGELDPGLPMDIHLREAGAAQAANAIAEGQYHLGILRYPTSQAAAFAERFRAARLSARTLREYDAQPVFSIQHPLAEAPSVSLRELAAYPEAAPSEDAPHRGDGPARRILTGSAQQQISVLQSLPTAYAWYAPEDRDALARLGLTQRPCAGGGRWRETLLRPADAQPSPLEERFLALAEARGAETQSGAGA